MLVFEDVWVALEVHTGGYVCGPSRLGDFGGGCLEKRGGDGFGLVCRDVMCRDDGVEESTCGAGLDTASGIVYFESGFFQAW